MARRSSKASRRPTSTEDQTGAEASGGVTKTEAVRQAVAAGVGSPGAAVDYIKDKFGLDMSRQHFSAVKSQLKKKDRDDSSSPGPRARRRRVGSRSSAPSLSSSSS